MRSPRWWALAAIAAVLVIPMRPTAAQPPPQQPTRSADLHAVAHQSNHANHPNPQNPPTDKSRHADSRNDDDAEPWVFVLDDDNAVLHGNALDLAYTKRLRNAQQHALSKQQAALSEEQAGLARHLEELHGSMEREMRNLFDAALAAGIAMPVR